VALSNNYLLIEHPFACKGLLDNICQIMQPGSIAFLCQFAQWNVSLEINMFLCQPFPG